MKLQATVIRTLSFVILVFLVASGFAYAADQALIDAAKKEGELSVYTSFPRRFLIPTGDLFKKMYGLGDDFNVKFTRKGTGALLQMVDAEHMTGRSNWDVISQGDEAMYLRWIEHGMLMKYQPPNINNFHEVFHDKLGYRVAHQLFLSSMAIYKARVPEKDWPESYSDALDPKWKGRVCLASPATAGVAIMFDRFILDIHGWKYFEQLAKNDPIIVKGNSAQEQLLLSGEADLALCPNEFSVVQRIRSGETNLKLIYSKEVNSFFIFWIAINKDSKHPNAAKLWMEFNATDERNELVADIGGLYVCSKNVTPKLRPKQLNLHQIDWQWIKEHKDEMVKKFEEVMRR
jgi:iron(III) transport system substrate-binding protein